MKLPFIKGSSIFKKLFILAFLVAVLPIGLSWLYFFYLGNVGDQTNLSFVFYGLFVLALVLAVSGAYYFSLQISRPITQFKNSALEIARGNFDHKISLETNDEIGKLAKIFDYMIEEFRKKHIQGSLSEKKQVDSILQGTGDGVIVTDSRNRVLRINAVAAKWFSLSENNEKKSIRDLIPNQALVKCIEEISKNSKKKSATIEITTTPKGEKKPKTLQALASRIEDDESIDTIDEEDRLIGVATILRDITREKEIDRLKTELVSLVAHELRSPLTCISGFSELLLDTGITRSQSQEYSSIILKESNRLSDLINKFLDISKIEAGKSQLRKTPVDMKMLIEKVLDFNSQLADKKEIKVSLEAPPEVSTISVDRDMIEQAILNLYSNAVKYSPKKSRVTVRLSENEKDLVIEFEDTGFGISEKSLPHIFDKFYRITDDDKVRDITGSGLGLSLVKEIIEIHDGQISVKSVQGKGSTFRLTIPKSSQALVEQEYRQEMVA